MSEQDLHQIHQHMQDLLLEKCGYQFDDIYFCGDLNSIGSLRRKPAPGMLLEAAQKWDIDLSRSWMIGDSKSDAEAGKKAGTHTILIGNYTYQECPSADFILPDLSLILPSITEIISAT
jgi:D-glycero-D-manno-heptose 1,7-bisphosphate phosphatase